MKVIDRLVIRNLKKNKTRTVVTIIGIVLSCALIVGTAGLTTSFRATMIESTKISWGENHATLYDVAKEDLTYLQNHKETEKYAMTESLGIMKLSEEYEFTYGEIIAADKEALEQSKPVIIEGRVPENSNEIMVTTSFNSFLDEDVEIGDRLSVSEGRRYIIQDGEKIYLDPQNEILDGEKIEKGQEKTYEVVGIADRPYFAGYINIAEMAVTYLDEVKESVDISLLYKNPQDYEKITVELMKLGKETTGTAYEVAYNSELLRWQELQFSDESMDVIIPLVAVIILIIMVTSIFCIRNSFVISISEKTRQYGMLASVGMTPKQIKKNVLKEAFWLGLVGIPLGILSGIIAVYALVAVVNIFINEPSIVENQFKFIGDISWIAVVIGGVLSAITIYLSAIGSARKARKINEIEAIKGSEYIKVKKRIKTPKIIGKLFKVGGIIAHKNMKRNKSKFRTTTVAIILSIVTFIAMSTTIDTGFRQIEDMYGGVDFDATLTVEAINSSALEEGEKFLEQIAQLKGVTESSIHRAESVEMEGDVLTETGKGYLGFTIIDGETGETVRPAYDEGNGPQGPAPITIKAVGEEEYLRYLKRLGLDYEEMKDKGILLGSKAKVYGQDGNWVTRELFKKGVDELDLAIGNSYNEDGTINNYGEKFKLPIEKADIVPMGVSENEYSPTVIVSDAFADEYLNVPIPQIYMKTEDGVALEEAIEKLGEEKDVDFYYMNMEEIEEVQNRIFTLFGIFFYGFLAVIILIGITSVVNTISTNMRLRSREFAIFKSIGMTKRELRRMVRLENIFYGAKSLLIGIPIGCALAYGIHLTMTNPNNSAMEDLEFVFPIKPILISIVAVVIIISLIVGLSLNKIEKQNIIEKIRDENI